MNSVSLIKCNGIQRSHPTGSVEALGWLGRWLKCSHGSRIAFYFRVGPDCNNIQKLTPTAPQFTIPLFKPLTVGQDVEVVIFSPLGVRRLFRIHFAP